MKCINLECPGNNQKQKTGCNIDMRNFVKECGYAVVAQNSEAKKFDIERHVFSDKDIANVVVSGFIDDNYGGVELEFESNTDSILLDLEDVKKLAEHFRLL